MPGNRKASVSPSGPRLRRAYFEVRFGQLHVHHAIPVGGGFDERTTLLCLPDPATTARALLPLLAQYGRTRSVYAADLPGTGESDPAGEPQTSDGAIAALGDFLSDMRLRQIDVLGIGASGAVARGLAARHPGVVRRVVVVGETAGRAALVPPPQPLLELAATDIASLARDPKLGDFLK